MLSYSTLCPQPTTREGRCVTNARHLSVLAPGALLNGCYRVRRVLGAGGMGYVYEARDEVLNRLVAIKMSRPDIPADTIMHEARIMAAFHHPGLPTVYAMGMHESAHYVVMERLIGRSLAQHMQVRGRFDESETRDLLLAIASSLEVLHRATLVHRDLKPANIMLVPPDRVVLFDFGVCDLERFASGGNIVGTKHYIAPELVTGRVRPGEAHLTDVYALGVIGFQLLVGHPPFVGDSVNDVLTRVLEDRIPPLADLRPDVSDPVTTLVMEMLSRDPGERPPVAMVRARLEHMARPQARRLTPRAPDQPLRLLVADRAPGIFSLLSYMLESHGYEVMRASDGAHVLESVSRIDFDVIITTGDLPGLDSLDLLRAIKQRSPTTDVIMIAGRGAGATEAMARGAGASVCLARPLDLDSLVNLVHRFAARHRARRQAGVVSR